jgi:Flp pilus assembly protein TadD
MMTIMSRRLAAPALVFCGFLLGCSTYQPFDSVAHLRGQYAGAGGPGDPLVVPFELDDEVRAALPVNRAPSELRRLNQVMEVIFERLDLRYELQPTRTAVETFRDGRGNCLSFVNLFVGLARTNGLNPFYVEVEDYQTWNQRGGFVVSQGHIVAGMYLDGELKTYDFLPYRPKAYRDFNPIDDVTAAAHFYNNLGAEALLAGDPARARELITVATQIAPTFYKAVNNLGVILSREGDTAGALAAYERALELDPANSMVLTNLARLYQRSGDTARADQLLTEVAAANTTNPFFFVYQADLALARGENEVALEQMTQALRLDTDNADVHVGLVKVYMALGDIPKARHHLARALRLDATNEKAIRLAHMLGG